MKLEVGKHYRLRALLPGEATIPINSIIEIVYSNPLVLLEDAGRIGLKIISVGEYSPKHENEIVAQEGERYSVARPGLLITCVERI